MKKIDFYVTPSRGTAMTCDTHLFVLQVKLKVFLLIVGNLSIIKACFISLGSLLGCQQRGFQASVITHSGNDHSGGILQL